MPTRTTATQHPDGHITVETVDLPPEPTTLQDLRCADIKSHSANPRADVGNVDELAASIASQGVLEPLLVVPDVKPGKYLALAGHRRLAAARQAKVKTVPCLVRHDLTDRADQIVAMLTENLQRADLTPAEEGRAYQQLLELPGWTQKKIAATSGRAARTVGERVKLTRLPEPLLAAQERGQLTLEAALDAAEFADDPKTLAALQRAAANPSSWPPYADIVRQARAARKNARDAARRVRELTAAGVKVLDGSNGEVVAAQADGALRVPNDLPGVDPTAHDKCPTHAVEVHTWGTTTWCLAPALHHPDEHTRYVEWQQQVAAERQQSGDRGLYRGTPESLAEQQQREEREHGLAAAAEQRRDHLYRWVFDREDDDVEGQAADLVREELLRQVASPVQRREDLAALLGIDIDGMSGKAVAEALRERLVTATAAQMILLEDIVIRGDERSLLTESGWDIHEPTSWIYNPTYGHGTDDRRVAWRHRVVDSYGWTYTDAEQAAYDEGARRRVARASTPEDESDHGWDVEDDEQDGDS